MNNSKLEQKVEEKISSKINELGYEIEYVEFVKAGDNNILRIVLDKKDGVVDIDGCELVSRSVESDIDTLISKEYVLEVSSPGIERDIKNIKLYKKYLGYEVAIKLYKKHEKYGKELTGILNTVNDEEINLKVSEDIVTLKITDISSAHTVYDFSNSFKNGDNVNLNKLNKFNKK